MDLHRIGRGVVERDLALEGDHRGFALGAVDSSHGFGLGAVELRRHARQPETRVFVADEDHAQSLGVFGQLGTAQHRARTFGDGVLEEARAVGLAPGQGREQKPLLNLAAVAGQAPELEAAQILCRHHGVLSFLLVTFVAEWGALMNFHPPEWPAVLDWGRPAGARYARSPGQPGARRFGRPARNRRWP